MREKIVLVGGGGHCKVVISVLKRLNTFDIVGISDIPERLGKEILGVPIKFTDDDLERLFRDGVKYAFITVGSVGNPRKRVELFNMIKEIGFEVPVIISQHALVSEDVVIGEGTIIMPGAIVNPGAKIGKNAIINTGAIIEHDVLVCDHTHIAPGVVLSGGVKVGCCSHIGTGASVIQEIEIGKNVIIGAGAVVTKNIPDGVIAKGVPARW